MGHLLNVIAVVLLMPSTTLGSPVSLNLEGDLARTDTGGRTVHTVVITNTGTVPILLDTLNKHRFVAPDFDRICHMKMPGSRWSEWKNVLTPGDSTQVRIPGGRLKAGTHSFAAKLTYRTSGSEVAQWHKTVVWREKPGPHEVVGCDRINQPKNTTVAYDKDVPKELTAGAIERSWQLTVKPHPGIVGLPGQDKIQDLVADVPHFGLVVWMDGLAHAVRGKELELIGPAETKGIERVGRALAAKESIPIRAVSPDTLKAAGFEVKAEERVYYTTARVSRWDTVKTWYTTQIPAEQFDRLKAILKKENVRLAFDAQHGLIIDEMNRIHPILGPRP